MSVDAGKRSDLSTVQCFTPFCSGVSKSQALRHDTDW
jgi:hypothetical protein